MSFYKRARRLIVCLACLVSLALTFSSSAATAQTKAPVIVAAADLQFALAEIATNFKQDTGLDVKLVFGSSGNFFRQIAQGAPFQMFLSADEDFVFRLANAGKTVDRGTLYAIGRIVIVAPRNSALKPDAELKDLAAALKDGRIKKFALANPEHAPYGKRAVEALQHAKLWDAIKDKLVLGENVSQAAQFAVSGSTQGGIIAYSLALSPALSSSSLQPADYALIPASWHQPLAQRMVLIKNADSTAQKFYRYLQQPAARALMKKHGFTLPGEV